MLSSVTAKYGASILLINGKTSTQVKKTNVIYFVIGGNSVVSRSLEDGYSVDRYSTNRKIINEFYYDSDKLYVAKGDTLVEALIASDLAKDNGIVLVAEKTSHKKLEGKNTL